MFERLKRLYNEGRLTVEAIHNAVAKGVITEEQANEILGNEVVEEETVSTEESTVTEEPTVE